MKIAEWEGTCVSTSQFGNGLIRIEGPYEMPMKAGDKIRVTVEVFPNDYPGQAYFHRHNKNIARAEENWERRQP